MRALVPSSAAVAPLAQALDEALELLRRAGKAQVPQAAMVVPGPSLLQQCLDLCAAAERRLPPPLRLVHAFPQAGLPWLLEALDTLPNAKLVRGLDPLGGQGGAGRAGDLIGAALGGPRPIGPGVAQEMFRAALQVLHAQCRLRGEHLVLHLAGHWLPGVHPGVSAAPLAWVGGAAPAGCELRSVVLVTHPLHSLLACAALQQRAGAPVNLPALVNGLSKCVASAAGALVLRVEQVQADPMAHFTRLAGHLGLPLVAGVEHYLNLPPPAAQREPAEPAWAGAAAGVAAGMADLAAQLQQAPGYHALCSGLGYPPVPQGWAAPAEGAAPVPGRAL